MLTNKYKLFAVGNAINVLYGKYSINVIPDQHQHYIGAFHANPGQHIPLDPAGSATIGPKLTALDHVSSSLPCTFVQLLTGRLFLDVICV